MNVGHEDMWSRDKEPWYRDCYLICEFWRVSFWCGFDLTRFVFGVRVIPLDVLFDIYLDIGPVNLSAVFYRRGE